MNTQYIIAGTAIWSVGSTEDEALAAYVADTGDDSLTLDTISRDPFGGHTYIVPATNRLVEQVKAEGGDISWIVRSGVADIHQDNDE